jgi:hypothetical protein
LADIIGLILGSPVVLFGSLFSALIVVALYGLMKMTAPVTKIYNFGESDRRLDEVKATGESPKGLRRDNKRNPQRWFKWKPAFLKVGINRQTTYLAKRGTAYTWNIENGENIKLGSFWDALNVLWSSPEQQKLITKIPQTEQQLLRNNSIYVTVDLDPGYKPPADKDGKEFQAITEEDLATEGDREMARIFAEGAQGARKTQIIPLLLALGSGGMIATLAYGLLGWLHIVGK